MFKKCIWKIVLWWPNTKPVLISFPTIFCNIPVILENFNQGDVVFKTTEDNTGMKLPETAGPVPVHPRERRIREALSGQADLCSPCWEQDVLSSFDLGQSSLITGVCLVYIRPWVPAPLPVVHVVPRECTLGCLSQFLTTEQVHHGLVNNLPKRCVKFPPTVKYSTLQRSSLWWVFFVSTWLYPELT